MFKGRSVTVDPALILLLVALGLLSSHLYQRPALLNDFGVEFLYRYEVQMRFEPDVEGVSIRTFLPPESEFQRIVDERIGSGTLDYQERKSHLNRVASWNGDGTDRLGYSALIARSSVQYELDQALLRESRFPEEIQAYLQATDAVQVNHPEVKALWQDIRPASERLLLPPVKAIYDYTYRQIDGAPFKGFTDALTALRLQQASCNGKSRLFVALARLNGIPARLVGGVILDGQRKKTSHQWVELYIHGHWVPFDPTNGHFAALPRNYLRLYTGDHPLFVHTSNINFDYFFESGETLLSSAVVSGVQGEQSADSMENIASRLVLAGMEEKAIRVFLLFPLCGLVITFLRNIVGVKMFGTFVPMLVAAACVYTGLVPGVVMFAVVLLFAFLSHWFLDRYRLLKVPRLAAIITMSTILILLLIVLYGERNPARLGMLSLFPVVIISFLAERIHKMADDEAWQQLLATMLGTLLTVALCYAVFSSLLLTGVFSLMPELLLLVLAALIYIGRWSGIRLSEYFRFRKIILEGHTIGINYRNRNLVYAKNDRKLLELAADKIRTKELLKRYDIPHAPNLAVCASQRDMPALLEVMRNEEAFVLKPNRGSQGQGIVVIRGRKGDGFLTAGGQLLSIGQLRSHVLEILSGSFSQDGDIDQAFVEPLIRQHPSLEELSNLGLADIRILQEEGNPIAAMLRLPTRQSDGKANLHQGAIGVSIDLSTGETVAASVQGNSLATHPDTGAELLNVMIPHWREIVMISRVCYLALPLGYLGVDICIDHERGPIVLEINGRPGLEIQNVMNQGLRNELGT